MLKKKRPGLIAGFIIPVALACGLAAGLYLAFFASPKQPFMDNKPGSARMAVKPSPHDLTTETEKAVLGAVIRAVALHPPQPTRLDTLRTDVVLQADEAGSASYTLSYRWTHNGFTLPEATGETLDLAGFNTGDLICVNITPFRDGQTGYTVSSPCIAVHPVAPTLELQLTPHRQLPGQPMTFQLASDHPDDEEVRFSLTPPLVPGMTVEERTGQIIWLLHPDQKGAVRFGAAVENSDRNVKVTREFEVTVQ